MSKAELSEKSKDELIKIIETLNAKNSKLSDSVSQMKVRLAALGQSETEDEPARKRKKTGKPEKVFEKRKIAIRFSYDGTRFNGLQRSPLSNGLVTIEDLLFDSMLKCKMIDSIGQSDYIAAGRTDKGVHAVNNVFSIIVNSNLTKDEIENDKTDNERDFVSMINRHLPPEIVVTCWAPVPFDFSARFSCESRSYNYIFHGKGLNISKMNEAAQRLVGKHDFQNFCTAQLERQDTSRECFRASVVQSGSNDMCTFEIESSGFLYHQIRLTMTLLALIGNELEDSELISSLLNLEAHPRRPGFKPANPDGLVLIDCKFPNLNWVTKEKDEINVTKKINDRLHQTYLQLNVLEKIKSKLGYEEREEKQPVHQRITGILQKQNKHRSILSYDCAPNPKDLLLKKQAKDEKKIKEAEAS